MTNVLLPSKMTYEISWSNSNITYHYFCCRFTDFRHEKRLCKNENWSIWGFSVTLITVYIPYCDHGFYLVSWVHTSGPLSQFHHHSSFILQYLQVGKQGYCGPASHDTMSDSACKKQWWWAFLLWHHTIPQMLVSPEMTHSDFTVQWPIYASLD